MSKESMEGVLCRCGNTITFHKEHWQNCPNKDEWVVKTKPTKEDKGGRGKRK